MRCTTTSFFCQDREKTVTLTIEDSNRKFKKHFVAVYLCTCMHINDMYTYAQMHM